MEVQYDAFDPITADSDGDGVDDGADDLDDDGLTNREEAISETELALNDTERDGLLDGRERDLGTDPRAIDTDEDGLNDPSELDVGTDPLDADTDGDGTLDGNETYTTETTDEESGVTLSVTGEGHAASETTVDHMPAYHNGTVASAGPTVYVRNRDQSSVEAAQVTVPVTEATEANARDLTVYVWNGSTNQTWQPVRTQVDIDSDTATARVESGQYITVLNRTAWQDAISVERKEAHEFASDGALNCSGTCDSSGETIAVGEGVSASADESGGLTATSVSSEQDGSVQSGRNTSDENETDNESSGDIGILCLTGPDGTCDEDEDGTLNGDDACLSTPGYAGEGCPDSDGDGIHNGDDECDNEAGPASNNGCPEEDEPSDRDNDGVPDGEDNCPDEWGSQSNGCPDDDYDNDGTPNDEDPCPRDRYDRCDDPPEDPDSDGDGVDDDDDNCPSTANPDQANADGDADGNVCDSDDDNDGIDDSEDNCPQTPNADEQDDRDNDGIGEACDSDEIDSDEASWQIDVPSGTSNVYFEFEYLASKDSNEHVNLTITGSNGETVTHLQDTGNWRERDIDLGQFAGETVTVSLETTGMATVRARDVRIYQDSDDDTLSDYRENQRWTIPYGYGDSFTLDPYDQDSDDDRLTDNEEVSLGPAPSNPASPLRVRYATSNPGEVDTDGDGLEDYEERQGETNAFLFSTDYDQLGDGEEIEHFGTDPLDPDTDNDSLEDHVEGEIRIHASQGNFIRTYTNPTDADTDGDGLPDAAEISTDGGYLSMHSDPELVDTDGDGLTDYEETEQINGDPTNPNIDSDSYIDGHDPEIRTENDAPQIEDFESDNYRQYIEFTIRDQSDIEIEANAYYGSLDESFWSTEDTHVTHEGGDRYRVEFDGIGVLNERPDKYWINVTDANGNEQVMLIEPNGGGAEMKKAGVLLAGVASAPAPDSSVPVRHIVGGILAGSALAVATYQSEYTAPNGEVLDSAPASGSARSPYEPNSPQLPAEIVIPTGVYVAENGVERGHGWRYIEETTSLTLDQIGDILDNPDRVVEEGDYRYVIEELPNGEEVILTIIGGVLVTASELDRSVEHDTSESNCNTEDFVVETENDRGDEGNPEHTLRDEKPVNDIDRLDDILRHPDRILDFDGHRYLIKTLEDGRTVAIVMHRNPTFTTNVYNLITQLTFESMSQAVEKIITEEQNGKNPTNDINC